MARTRLVAIDYRLAPEHPHPHALEDALAAYRALLDTGVSADQVALAGESAGGGLALALALALRDAGDPLPAGIACLSPWVDLTDTSPELAGAAPHDFVVPTLLHDWASSYAGDVDPADPAVSPALGDLGGLPPLLVLLGGGEVLCAQGERLAAAARRDEVDVRLEVWPDMVHAWPMFPVLPEARRALRQIAAFLGSHLAPASRPGAPASRVRDARGTP
jgi:acetyl esterase/lipase